MKIANIFTINNIKAALTKTAMAGLVAGAAFLATPATANAQLAFGVHAGPVRGYFAPRPIYVEPRPVYVPPVYVAPGYGYYGPRYVGPGFYDRRYGWEHRDRRFYR